MSSALRTGAKIVRFILLAFVLTISERRVSAAEPVTVDTLSAEYAAKYSAVSILRCEYKSTMHLLGDGASIWRDMTILIGPWSTTKSTVVADGIGRVYVSRENEWARLEPVFARELAAEFQQAVPQANWNALPFARVRSVASRVWETREQTASVVRRAPTVALFDGSKLWQHNAGQSLTTAGVSRKAFISIDPKRLHGPYFDRTVFDCLLLAFPTSLVSDQDARSSNRLSMLARQGRFQVESETETVDGTVCIVAGNPETQRIWFDPEVGFAVRKRVWMERGVPWFEFVATDFSEAIPTVWLPKRFRFVHYGALGTPIFREDCETVQLTCNDNSDTSAFDPGIETGSFVIDETLAAPSDREQPEQGQNRNPRINPSVSYIQPANNEDLEKVIEAARTEQLHPANTNPLGETRTNAGWALIGLLNVLLIAVLAGAIAAWRYFVRRR
jgi:hypothetical protein